MVKNRFNILLLTLFIIHSLGLHAQRLIPVAKGWSTNSVNTVAFRKNSLVTQADTQFVAFYTPDGVLALGKRHLKDGKFTISETQYSGNAKDAHNSISIMIDGAGYLHVSWDHHGQPLRYAKSVVPYSLELGAKTEMTGANEGNVTYPQFFKLADGNLIFMFRDGQSGKGNLVVNRYDVATQKWRQIQHNLIDGEGKRNAYWQSCIDCQGVIHLSWVWRETWDVASNHDLCYAQSKDGGFTWENSKGKIFTLPINVASAEYAAKIPQNSELINQTSMTTNNIGQPVIASYWRKQDSDIPQYHIVCLVNGKWVVKDLTFRKEPFSLSGSGTKRIPIARPQIVVQRRKKQSTYYLIFRDEERGSKVSVARVGESNKCKIYDLTDFSVGSWEPTFDTELWKDKGICHLFVQNVVQIDAEGTADFDPQTIYILEVDQW